MRIVANYPDTAAFAPFGALIEGPALHGDRRIYSDWLTPVAALSLQFHVNSVAASDLPELYHGASVYVQASDEEGLGISMLEAMASGLPVVATDLAG